MNLHAIEETSATFVQNLSWLLKQDGYVLTDIAFYKGDESMAHVEIRAKRRCSTEDKPMWWVCALPLPIPNEYMLPSQGVIKDD